MSASSAQCHKHPYDQWTKQDFDQFTAFFGGIRYGASHRPETLTMKKGTTLEGLDEDSGDYKRKFADLLAGGKVLPFKELSVPQNAKPKPGAKPGVRVGGRVITPKLLGGEEVVNATYSDPRQPIVDWMRDAENPYFARAFVNRVWANYFGASLIDPPDDLNLANPPTNPELLDYLADGFVSSKFDMKWLHRTIMTSHAYQRSWKSNETNTHDEKNHSRAVLRRLPAEVVVDALALVTASDDERKKLTADPAGLRDRPRERVRGRTRERLRVRDEPVRQTGAGHELRLRAVERTGGASNGVPAQRPRSAETARPARRLAEAGDEVEAEGRGRVGAASVSARAEPRAGRTRSRRRQEIPDRREGHAERVARSAVGAREHKRVHREPVSERSS